MNHTSITTTHFPTASPVVGAKIVTHRPQRQEQQPQAFVKDNHDAIAECQHQLFNNDNKNEKNDTRGLRKRDKSSNGFRKDYETAQLLVSTDHPARDIPTKETSIEFSSLKDDRNEQPPSSSSKPSVETAVSSSDADPALSVSKQSKPPARGPIQDGSPDRKSIVGPTTVKSSPGLLSDAPSDECSALAVLQGQDESHSRRRTLFPQQLRSRSNIEKGHCDDDVVDGSFYNCFSICYDMDDMASVFSEITLDAIFGKCAPTPPVLPSTPTAATAAPLEAAEAERGNVWAIELLDGKHQKGDTLWFRLSGHGEANEAMHYKDLEGIEVLDYVHAVAKVQESPVFYILKDNGEGMWVESDWVRDAMVEILMMSKRDEEISIPTLRSLRKKNKKRKKRWFPWPRSSHSW